MSLAKQLTPPARPSPFDRLQAARLDAHLALIRPQVAEALAHLGGLGVVARVVGSYASGRFRLGSDVDFLIEKRGAASLADIFEAIASALRDAPFDIVYWENLSPSGRAIMLDSNPEHGAGQGSSS